MQSDYKKKHNKRNNSQNRDDVSQRRNKMTCQAYQTKKKHQQRIVIIQCLVHRSLIMACWSDDNSCDNRLINGDTTQYNLHLYSRKDGCLLLANGPRAKITELQSLAQFSMWAISSAQLLISHVRKDSNYTFETYSNTHAIVLMNINLANKVLYISNMACNDWCCNFDDVFRFIVECEKKLLQ